MKKLLILALLFVGCEDFAPTNHTHENDTTIDREFVVVKTFQSASYSLLDIGTESIGSSCPTDNPADCAGECGGDAVEQTYYYDYDSDGLGDSDYSHIFCSANVQEGWVLNSDDDDDRLAGCIILYTFNILEDDLEETINGNISFSYNNEDYLIDISSCNEIEVAKVTKIIQDTNLNIFYAYTDLLVETIHYSTPNELLYVK